MMQLAIFSIIALTALLLVESKVSVDVVMEDLEELALRKDGSQIATDPQDDNKPGKAVQLDANANPGNTYDHLGCWKDQRNPRAIGGEKTKVNSVSECYKRAKNAKYTVFAVESKDECFTHPNAWNTYNKHGRVSGCENGEGGHWKMDVYRINYAEVCETFHVGSSSENSKTTSIPAEYVCPTRVDQNNWVNSDEYTDVFAVTQLGDSATVRLANFRFGWGMDLKFKCCKKPNTDEAKCEDKLPTASCLNLNKAYCSVDIIKNQCKKTCNAC